MSNEFVLISENVEVAVILGFFVWVVAWVLAGLVMWNDVVFFGYHFPSTDVTMVLLADTFLLMLVLSFVGGCEAEVLMMRRERRNSTPLPSEAPGRTP